ncbi:MAG: hypothetical protein RIR96_367 [Bacteroidota bacterium]|jgi:4-hydroxybenzoate polyprenyltransferase
MRIRRFFTGFLYTALAAVAMVLQTSLVLNQPITGYFYFFVLSLVVVGYHSYYLLTAWQIGLFKTYVFSSSHLKWRIWVLLLFFPVLIATSFSLNFELDVWLVLGLLFIFYFAIRSAKGLKGVKRLGWIKTIGLSCIWVYVTFYLPVKYFHVSLDSKIWVLMVQRFCFFFLIALFFDLRDQVKDLQDRKSTIATQFGKPRLLALVLGLIFVSAASIYCSYQNEMMNLWSTLVLNIAVLFVVCLIYRHEQIKNRLNYLILGDGSMILSTVLLFVDRISLLC